MKYWQETLAIAQRILQELWRRRRSLIFWVIFPIAILVLNSMILEGKGQLSRAKAFETAAPSTLVGAALFFSCVGGSLATIVGEREQQTIKRLFISPLSGVSYFLGIFLAYTLIGIGQTLLIYTIAAFFGAEFQGSIWLGILLILLCIMAYVGVGFMLGTQLARRTEDVNSLVATFGVPLLILGGAFLPTSLFPKSLLNLAKYNPVYHINEAMIAVASKGESLEQIQGHFWFLLIFAICMVVGGWISYSQTIKSETTL